MEGCVNFGIVCFFFRTRELVVNPVMVGVCVTAGMDVFGTFELDNAMESLREDPTVVVATLVSKTDTNLDEWIPSTIEVLASIDDSDSG